MCAKIYKVSILLLSPQTSIIRKARKLEVTPPKGGFNVVWVHLATCTAMSSMKRLLNNMQLKQNLYSLYEL